MGKHSMIARYGSEDTFEMESETVIVIPNEATAEEVLEKAESEIAEVQADQQVATEETSEVVAESIALESCVTGLRSLMNLESISEDLEGNDTTAEEAAAAVQEEVVTVIEKIDPELVGDGEEGIALEMDVKGAAMRFWERVKEIAKKIKDSIVSLFNMIITRFARAWDNLLLSSSRIKKSAEYLTAGVKKTNWDDSVEIPARSQWVVDGKVDAKLIADAVSDQILINRLMVAAFDQAVKTFADAKTSPELLKSSHLAFSKELQEQESRTHYIGFTRKPNSVEYITARLEAETDVKVGPKMTILRLAGDVAVVADFVSGELAKKLKKNIAETKKAVEAAVEAATKVLAESTLKEADEEKKKKLVLDLADLKAKQLGLSGLVSSSSWLFKGLPLRSATNAMSFGTAALAAVLKKKPAQA